MTVEEAKEQLLKHKKEIDQNILVQDILRQ